MVTRLDNIVAKKTFQPTKKKEGVKIASKYKLIYETLTGMQTKRLLNKILLFSFSCIFLGKVIENLRHAY